MALSKQDIEAIAQIVIQILYLRFQSFPEDSLGNRNAPFHEAFLKAFSDRFSNKVSDVQFFISLSSWLHGLNTTLGQSFFEQVAHILSDGDKLEHTSKRAGNLKLSKKQKDTVNEIITSLSNSTYKPDLIRENKAIFVGDAPIDVNAMDFSADVFYIEDTKITAIELKSVKPNSGEMKGKNTKSWKLKPPSTINIPIMKLSFS